MKWSTNLAELQDRWTGDAAFVTGALTTCMRVIRMRSIVLRGTEGARLLKEEG